MDTIFYNGKINTFDEAGTVCSAMRATNGIISALGSDDELRSFATSRTEAVDLKGAMMFPGFMEAHNHLSIYGYLNDGLDLTPAKVNKMDDILELVKGKAEILPKGSWIKGSCYTEYFLAENRHPTRWDLDKVSPKHPVVLYHTSFHACVLNSLALKIFKLTPDTLSPEGGIIEKDTATGDPTGVLHDAAIQTLSMCQEAEQAGQLKIRMYTMNHAPSADPLVNAQIKTGFGSGTW